MDIKLVHPPKNKRYTIIIVGCGGTGSWVARDVMRTISASSKGHKVLLVDGDNVETKNLVRQNFIEKDLGLNKARVLAGRYGSYYRDIDVVALPMYLESPQKLKEITNGKNIVFIGCVDNNKTRKIIYDTYKDISDSWWIDSGNEEINGQVICGYNNPAHKLPCVADVFPNVLDGKDKLPTELSCAEQAESAPQHMYINNIASTVVMNYLNKILFGEAISNYVVYFSVDNVFKSILNNGSTHVVPTVHVKERPPVNTTMPVGSELLRSSEMYTYSLKDLRELAKATKKRNNRAFNGVNFYRVNKAELIRLLDEEGKRYDIRR